MNHLHRIVWSAVRGAFVVTHELASGHGKPASTRGASAPVLARLSAAIAAALTGAMLATATWAAPP